MALDSLADCQSAFAEFLRARPETSAAGRVATLVAGSQRSVERRLEIYRNNVYARLISSLSDTYPVVMRLVGEAFFRVAALSYIARIFPSPAALIDFGRHFPEFLGSFEPAATLPYLGDVAELEWLYLDAYHAAEAECVSPENFRRLIAEPANGAVRLHPSARLMRSPHQVSRIWEFNMRADDAAQRKLRLTHGGEFLLIIRPEASVEVRRLSAAAYRALSEIDNGASYSEALELARDSVVCTDVARQLESLAAGRTFTKS